MGAIEGYDIPYREKRVRRAECPRCHGYGVIFYEDYTETEVTKEVWDMLPEKYQHKETCEKCGGSGFIEEEWS